MKQLYKSFLLGLCFMFVTQFFGQEVKIENYKRWKSVYEQLTALKDRGVLLLRLQDFENSKHYIKSNYEISTYKLYVKKIEKYNQVLERDISKGFTFCKVYVFNSKLSKHILSNEMEKIDFLDPKTGNIKSINRDVPHIFAQIKDLKLSRNTNPLNFSSQRIIQILDRQLKKNNEVDLQQDFFYHSNVKKEEQCPHVFEAAKKISLDMEALLLVSEKKKKRLKRQIKSKHQYKIKELKKKITTMKGVKNNKITDQHRMKLDKKIEEFEQIIKDIHLLENEIFYN